MEVRRLLLSHLITLELVCLTFQTLTGIVMATYLPNFRPDLAIVHIPGGSLRAVQRTLYTNIGLLRMGCTGRSALTLGEPK